MANALNRNLKTGDKLALSDKLWTPGTVVTVTGECFGCQASTMGTAIMVKDDTDSQFRIHGVYDIDAEKTLEQFKTENGWTD